MQVIRYNHSFSNDIKKYINCVNCKDTCRVCEDSFRNNSLHFTNDTSILIDVGDTIYQTSMKENSSLVLYSNDNAEYYYNYVNITPTLSYYNIRTNNYTFSLILRENDICRKVGFFEDYHSSSNAYYSIHHNSIFQLVSIWDTDDTLLVRVQLGKTSYDTKTTVVKIPFKYKNEQIRICQIPYQDYILVLNKKSIDKIDLSGNIVKSKSINHKITKTYEICCTEKNIIVIGANVYRLREVEDYYALFYNAYSLKYKGDYQIDYTSVYHDKYYSNFTLTCSLGHDIALLCNIKPDEFVFFYDKKRKSQKKVEDCIIENTGIYRDVSKIICDYIGGFFLDKYI